MKLVKPIAVIFTIIVIADLLALAFRLVTVRLFWMVVLLCAVVAYFWIPKLRKMEENI